MTAMWSIDDGVGNNFVIVLQWAIEVNNDSYFEPLRNQCLAKSAGCVLNLQFCALILYLSYIYACILGLAQPMQEKFVMRPYHDNLC